MNTEEIIKLACEAASGMLSYDAEGNWRLGEKEVERFATLVRNAVLEECASEFEGQYTDSCPTALICALLPCKSTCRI